MLRLHALICRAAEKAVIVALVAALLLAGAAAYFFANDAQSLGTEARWRAELTRLDEQKDETQRQIEALEIEIPPEKERVVRSENVVKQLRQLKSTWGWLGVNRAQERANAERLEKMEAFHADAVAKLTELQQELRRLRWARDGYEIERDRLAAKLAAEEARKASLGHLWSRVWQRMRGWLLLGAAVYLIGLVVMPVWWRRRNRGRAAAI